MFAEGTAWHRLVPPHRLHGNRTSSKRSILEMEEKIKGRQREENGPSREDRTAAASNGKESLRTAHMTSSSKASC